MFLFLLYFLLLNQRRLRQKNCWSKVKFVVLGLPNTHDWEVEQLPAKLYKVTLVAKMEDTLSWKIT